jgi:hypothetical protein
MHRRCLSLLAKGCGTMALTFVPYMTKRYGTDGDG